MNNPNEWEKEIQNLKGALVRHSRFFLGVEPDSHFVKVMLGDIETCMRHALSRHDKERMDKGQEVVICDGLLTGKFGTTGGRKGTSVAVCIPDGGHDCDGMCPSGGTYEPEYALLRVSAENKQAIELLVSHLVDLSAHDKERTAEVEAKVRKLTEITSVPDNPWNKGYFDALEDVLTTLRSPEGEEEKI